MKIDAAAHGEFDGIAEHVDQDLAQAPFVGAHHRRNFAGRLVGEGQPLVARLQFEHADDLLQEIGEIQRPDVERQLAALDAGDVERALDDRQQVVAALADDADRLPAVGRHAFVGVENLRVAEDAVERRPQFVADRGDVAALGLVGLLGDLAGFLQGFVGALVRFDFLHQQLRLAVGFLLRHLTALLGQHHPPGADAGQ